VRREVSFAIVGGGLMGREFASAAARWAHLSDIGVAPRIAAVCDVSPAVLEWYERLDPPPRLTDDYEELLADDSIEAVYCAVPHHLHRELYTAILRAGKHLLGEKPFGIDLAANEAINEEIAAHPDLHVRCSSELPFYPGGQEVARWIAERRFGRVVEVRSLFLHSSDLDPRKPINWKRQARFNGEYGCMGDLGMHALHLPLRAGWEPLNVRAILSDVVRDRPGPDGKPVPCDTWDNAVLLCEAEDAGERFPLRIETKRIAPGETNTWTIEVDGTAGSIAYTTKLPKTLRWMDYEPGARQPWQVLDLGSESAYPTITGAIFEFGFSDAILQMWGAYLDELAHGRDGMRQPFHCATPEEAAATHRLFTAALESQRGRSVVEVGRAAPPIGSAARSH
jgi:predicted dehydrogenase